MEILAVLLLLLGVCMVVWVILGIYPAGKKPQTKIPPPPEFRRGNVSSKSQAKKATKIQIKQSVSRMQRMRDRYANAGDTYHVQVIDQYIYRTNDPLITILELELLDNALNSGDSYAYTDTIVGSGGNFGGGGSNGTWVSSDNS